MGGPHIPEMVLPPLGTAWFVIHSNIRIIEISNNKVICEVPG